MGGGLADEDEVPAGFLHGLANRLPGEQVVAEEDRVEGCIAPAVGDEPALGRPVLAILLVGAILGNHEFRLQRDDLVMPRRDQRRRQHGMVIFRLVLAPPPGRAVRTMDLARAMILRAVERDQHMPTETAEDIQPALEPPELLDHVGEHRMQQRRRRRVQHVPDMVVARDLRDPEQRRAVRPPMAQIELTLMRQKRRALHEKHRKRRHAEIGHRIARVQAPALVRKSGQARAQRIEQGFEQTHPFCESRSRSLANPNHAQRVIPSHPSRQIKTATETHSH